MAIEITSPIVVPPQSERVADKVWILNMSINASRGATSPATATFVVAPYVSDTGEILVSQQQRIMLKDVFATCATNPTLIKAVEAIYSAVGVLCKENSLFGMTPDPIDITITKQPENVSIIQYQAFTLSVEATGRPIAYQWFKDGVAIEGATNSQYRTISAQLSDAGTYSVTLTNTLGNVVSNDVVVSVIEPQPEPQPDIPPI